ncbi:MAG: hypothetical protein RLZZ67_326 [Candidatus Parcubacteria bacterium]|jgi:peptidylprolyl isomerase
MKRIWFPGLIALIIIGAVYFSFFRGASLLPKPAPATGADLFAEQAAGAGQGKDSETATGDKPMGPERPTAAGTTGQNGNLTNDNQNIMNAILHTNLGDITIAFNPATPKTTENFIKLAKSGFYNGTKFHRVIKGFMNQTGDPLSKDDAQMARWGTGGPGYQFADEIGAENHNVPGTIAMANAGPNTNGSQFFINVADNSFLDTKHTVFAMVTEGAEAVMAINNTKTGANDRPVEPVIITSIELK